MGSMAVADAAIKALKLRSKRYAVTDDRGLPLETYPSGGMARRYRYRLYGRLEKVALGKYPAISLKAARAKRDELATRVAHGQSTAQENQLPEVASATASTVAEFGERHLPEIVARDPKDTRILRHHLDKVIYPASGRKAVAEVTAADTQRIVSRSGITVLLPPLPRSATCASMWDCATVCGIATASPASALPRPFIAKARPTTRALSEGELRSTQGSTRVRHPASVQARAAPHSSHFGTEVGAVARPMEGRGSGHSRLAPAGGKLEDRCTAYRVPV